MSKRFQYFMRKDLRDQAHELYHRGGPFRKAGEKVLATIQLITHGDANPLAGLTLTNHGESRLEHCLKYDLASACRLVTVQDKGKCILLFAGDHEDEEKWLNANRGKKFVIGQDKKIEEVQVVSSTVESVEKLSLPMEYSSGKLYEHLKTEDFDRLVDGIPRAIVRDIEEFHSFSSDDEILDCIEKIQGEKLSNLIFDVIWSLKGGDAEEAGRRIALHFGELKKLDDSPLESGERIHLIPDDDPAYSELFAHFVKTANYKQWMLFMHPAQQEIVDIDFSGAGKLVGVSGSGKTCVVVRRAVRLAEKYANEKILVVTLNRSLSLLIKELVDVVCPEPIKNRIEVKPFFTVCQSYLHEFEAGSVKLYNDKTWRSNEHIDEVWTEFYRCELNNIDAAVMLPVHDYLIAQGVDAAEYIRAEFDWIRSAVPHGERSEYLDMEREGRTVPMSRKYREMLLEGLSSWERKMKAIGVTDYLGLAAALIKHEDKLVSSYRCTLIDESQDFGTMEMRILRKITKPGDNDIFVCGDAAQRVSTKFQSLKNAGIDILPSKSRRILKNYRNSREILSAAYKILSKNMTDELSRLSDFEVLDPEFSNFSNSSPLLLEANTLSEELGFAMAYAKSELEQNPNWKACIAICGYSLFEIQEFALPHKIPVLDGTSGIGAGSIFFSDLEQTKGFEFDVVIVVNASSNVLPNPGSPERERYRDLSRFYVAMTRSKSSLVVSFSGTKSIFLDDAEDDFLSDKWESYLHDDAARIEPPLKMSQRPCDIARHADILFMSGPEFLYSEMAIGVSGLLITKLREIIPGVSIRREGAFVQWKNIGSAFDSARNDVKSRQVFGPEGLKLFYDFCEKWNIPEKVKKIDKKELYVGS